MQASGLVLLLAITALLAAVGPSRALTFTNAPKTIPVMGHPRGAALFAAINKAYAYDSDWVTTFYASTPTTSEALGNYTLALADLVITMSRLDDSVASNGWSQLPIGAYGFVATLPAVATSALVLDRAALVGIWSGAITHWDDPAIMTLNGGVAPLTGEIMLVVSDHTSAADEYSSLTGVFGRALASFDPEGFGAAYAASGGRLAQTVMDLAGAARVIIANTSADRTALAADSTIMATTYALSEDTHAAGLRWASLINRAGARLDAPTSASLASALTDFDPIVAEGRTDVDIVDGQSAGSWPLAGIMFAVIEAHTDRSDCTFTNAVLTVLSWLQLNDGAIGMLSTSGIEPLTLGFRRRVTDAICAVTCNGQPAISASVFIGSGSPLPLWTGWSQAYDPLGASFRLKYFESTQIIAAPLARDYKIDFAGVVMPSVPAAYLVDHPDMRLVPVAIHSFSVGYNLPGIPRSAPALVLSLPVLADIYLGVIETWNDPRIVVLNPQLAPYLLATPIRVVLNKGGPVSEAGGPAGGLPNQALASMLSIVPGFAGAVYNGTAITYPVEATGRAIQGGRSGMPIYISNTTDSIGCFVYSSMSSYRAIRFADLINADGGVVSPTGTALTAAATAVTTLPASTSLLVNAPGAASWPMAQWDFVMVHGDTLPNCRKTTALLDWLYWTQTSPDAARLAFAEGSMVASSVEWMAPRVLASIARVRCPATGLSAFSMSACVTFAGSDDSDSAIMCSGHGQCRSAACVCADGWTGPLCERPVSAVSDSDSSSSVVAAAIGASLGGAGLLVLLILGVGCIVAVPYYVAVRRRLANADEWETSIDDIDMGPLLGRGGFGEVHRGTWRGTDVAVKTLPADALAKADIQHFKDEVHPQNRPPLPCPLKVIGYFFSLEMSDLSGATPSNFFVGEKNRSG
jgi:ABC-type phosphate transport system substrate-binding protein